MVVVVGEGGVLKWLVGVAGTYLVLTPTEVAVVVVVVVVGGREFQDGGLVCVAGAYL